MTEVTDEQEEAEPRFLLFGAEPARADAVAAVLAVLAPAGLVVGAGWGSRLTEIGGVAREHGAALLVQDDLELGLEADGVHLSDLGLVREVRAAFDRNSSDRLILGADVSLSRHEAMVAGEEGADYVAFGQLNGPADDAVIDLIKWWQEVTVLPCLAHVGTIDAVSDLANLGVDFIGIDQALWQYPDGPLAAAETLRALPKKN